MSDYIKRSVLGVSTCSRMHDHGSAKLTFAYKSVEPLVFFIHTNVGESEHPDVAPVNVRKVTYEVYRESVFNWLVNAPAGSVLQLGDTTFKIRLSMPFVVTIKFPLVELATGQLTNPMVMLPREWLQRFLVDTYVVVPSEVECDYLKIDECIMKLIEKR